MPLFTHVGFTRELASAVHAGKLYGHGEYAGVSHALNGPHLYEGAQFTALCGKRVTADHDGESLSVTPSVDSKGVTCKRCLKLLQPQTIRVEIRIDAEQFGQLKRLLPLLDDPTWEWKDYARTCAQIGFNERLATRAQQLLTEST